MKIRLRIIWFILAVLLFSAVFVTVLKAIQVEKRLEMTREIYRANETQTTQAMLTTIQYGLEKNDWQEITRNITQSRVSSGSIRLAILKKDGTVLADSYNGPSPRPINRDLVTGVMQTGEATLWEPGRDILEMSLLINMPNSHDAAIFVRETDLSAQLSQVRKNLLLDIFLTSAAALLVILLILLSIWQVIIKPLFQMRRVVEGVSQGDVALRILPAPMRELDDLGKAFNQMLDQLETQHKDLENTNRNLEQIVAIRTLQIEQRAANLEALNVIIHAASTANDLEELVNVALEQILQLTNASFGRLRIGHASASHNISTEMVLLFNEIEKIHPGLADQKIVITDWAETGHDLDGAYRDTFRKIKAFGVRWMVSLPIHSRGEIGGRLMLGGKSVAVWDTQDVSFEIIGNQLGDAAERMRAYQKSIETGHWMTRLAEQSELLNRSYTFEEVVHAIGSGGLALSGADRGAFFLVSEDQYSCPWKRGISTQLAQTLITCMRDKSGILLPVENSRLFIANTSEQNEIDVGCWRASWEGVAAYGVWPLTYEHRISAYFFCFYDEPVSQRQVGLEAMDAFARQAASALENARLFEAERAQSKLANALRDVAATLTSTLDLNEVFERILSNLGKVIQHDSANVMMVEGEGVLIMRSQGYEHTKELKNWRNPLGRFKILEQVRQSGLAVAIPNTSLDSRWIPLPESQWVRSYACAPMRSRGKVIGFLNVHSRQAGFFDVSKATILQVFADQATIAIENAQQYGTTRQIMAETGTLYRALTPLFDVGGDIESVTTYIVNTLMREFPLLSCVVFLIDREREVLDVIKAAGETEMDLGPVPLGGAGLIVAAVNSGKAVYAPDVHADKRYRSGNELTQSEFDIPLIASNEVIGVLNLESLQLDAFSPQMQRILVSFTERAGWVVENALLFGAAQTSARQMKLLNEITQVSLQNGDIAYILGVIAQKVAELLGADGCYLTGWSEKTRSVSSVAAWGPDAEKFMNFHLRDEDNSLTLGVIRAGHSIPVENVATSTEIYPKTAEVLSVASLLGVPLVADEQIMGAILIGYSQRHIFRKAEIGLAEQAAGQIALVIARRNSIDLAQRRAEESEKLRQATAALTQTLDLQQVYELIISQFRTLIHFDSVILYLNHGDKLKPVAYENIPMENALLEMEYLLEDSVFQKAQQTGLPIALDDAQREPQFKNWGNTHALHSFLGVPIFSETNLMGGISLGRFEIQPFHADEILLARLFANQAAVALQNAILHNREQQLAITDPLTGLYNRRGFFGLARHEVDRARRFSRPLSAMMIDVDHFKNVNDAFGHPVGDLVLCELAKRLHEEMREADLLCRYGGEEFLVLLPESDLDGACAVAERILSSMRDQLFQTPDHDVQITVSIGVAVLRQSVRSFDELIEDADQALLVAKAQGRDRLSVWVEAV